ncbi:hypothetical protein AB4225_00635 [Streptomyces sp. 2RAF24]|uniref:hypothetical protein n=1 Tax=Streptomyces sp. 2RAF24 TaxID=3232997 RepID=UPI003F954C71
MTAVHRSEGHGWGTVVIAAIVLGIIGAVAEGLICLLIVVVALITARSTLVGALMRTGDAGHVTSAPSFFPTHDTGGAARDRQPVLHANLLGHVVAWSRRYTAHGGEQQPHRRRTTTGGGAAPAP